MKTMIASFAALFLFFPSWGTLSLAPASAKKKKAACERKRQTCLRSCVVKSRKRERTCKSDSLKQRQACLRSSHQSGRTCLKNAPCPDADKCRANCQTETDPVLCYERQGCDKKASACYSSCQEPLGSGLKQCLDQTEAKLKGCGQDTSQFQFACQTSCPACN